MSPPLNVVNTERRFGEANQYIYRQIDGEDALFTEHELRTVLCRAKRNKEDLPNWWQRLVCRVFGIHLW